MFGGVVAVFAYQTIKSQRHQIGEQRQFIGEQLRFMAEQQENLTLERAELRAAAEDRRWAQARRVRMTHRKAGGSTDGQDVVTRDDHWRVIVVNESDAPVTQVEVRFGTVYLASDVYEWNAHRIDPMSPPDERTMTPVQLLGPGRALLFKSQQWPPATVHNSRPVLHFTDGNGMRWSLDSKADLQEAHGDDAW
ncbi:hypothetical protein OG458_40540 [Streptomyces sp. NBC_01281]|uniref:hypothetical protein n=1 Tax=unclassified Streptomyces TaxID=2593676 RepID=UPI0013B82E29|nr:MULTISPECIES: hypothetical protein [unclassified Streptomyces]NEB28562.1 hypothetical protein [Streptomyces sp. SID14446]WSK65697.1 hypothetical protein OG458_40540 [Streptomyces sp. NBC_01281]